MSKHLANISIDETHSMAVCTEIGERLRSVLKVNVSIPGKLAALLARFDEVDFLESPSIIPSMHEAPIESPEGEKVGRLSLKT